MTVDARVIVEHCVECEQHQWCTRHKKERYADCYTKLVNAIREKFPDVEVVNHIDVNKIKPRVGSFEVRIHKELFHASLFSKLSCGQFPSIPSIVSSVEAFLDSPSSDTAQACASTTPLPPRPESSFSASPGRGRAESPDRRSRPRITAAASSRSQSASPTRKLGSSPGSLRTPAARPNSVAEVERSESQWVYIDISDVFSGDLDNLFTILDLHKTEFKKMFFHYSGAVKDAADDVMSISSQEFYLFCKDCKLISAKLSMPHLNLVFMRVLAKNKGTSLSPENCLSLDEFVEAVVRISLQKFPKMEPEQALEKLISTYLVPNAGKLEVNGSFAQLWKTRSVRQIATLHQANLFKLYKGYSHKNQELREFGMQSLDAEEIISMMVDSKMNQRGVTPDIVRKSFLQVNIGDLLAEESSEDDRKAELTYDEFVECLALIDLTVRPTQSETEFAKSFDKFLQTLIHELYATVRKIIISKRDIEIRELQRQQNVKDEAVLAQAVGAAGDVVYATEGDGAQDVPSNAVREKFWVLINMQELAPSATQEKALKEVLLSFQAELKRVFWFYCAASADGGSAISMSAQEYYIFCKDCKLITRKTPFARLNLVFTQVCARPASGVQSPDKSLGLDDFVEVVVRLAKIKQPTMEVQDATTHLIENKVMKYAGKFEVTEGFEPVFRSPAVQEVLGIHSTNLYKIYKAYSHANQEIREGGVQSIDIDELLKICRDAALNERGVTTEITRRVFQEVNFEDLMQESEGTDERKGELTFDEFLECLGRMHHILDPTDDAAKFASGLQGLISHIEFNLYKAIRSTILTDKDAQVRKTQQKMAAHN